MRRSASPVRVTPLRFAGRRLAPLEAWYLTTVAAALTFALLLVGARAASAEPRAREASRGASPGEAEAGALAAGPSGYALRYVPPAAFPMGSPEAARRVTLTRGLWVGEVEVSQALWFRVMASVSEGRAHEPSWLSCVGASASLVGPDLPMMCASFCDAVAFANALSRADGLAEAYPGGCDPRGAVTWDRTADGYRLPTDAEWEWAAWGGEPSSPFDAEPACSAGNLASCDDGARRLAPVGFRANGYGLYDMVGNVWEWTWDWHDPAPSPEPAIDPTGPLYRPSAGAERTVRGASWAGVVAAGGVANRASADPFVRSAAIGLRVVRSDRLARARD